MPCSLLGLSLEVVSRRSCITLLALAEDAPEPMLVTDRSDTVPVKQKIKQPIMSASVPTSFICQILDGTAEYFLLGSS